MKNRRLFFMFVIAGILFSAAVLAADRKMVYQYAFPTEAMLDQEIYLKLGAGMACDREGNVWVADSGQRLLLQFDPAGKFLRKVGRSGQGPGEFQNPATIHIAENGDLFVLDTTNFRMTVLSAEGEFKRDFKLFYRYEDFFMDGGYIYLTHNNPREDGKTIDVYSTDGEFLESFGKAPDLGRVHPYNARVAGHKFISGDSKGRLLIGWMFFPIVHVLDAGRKAIAAEIEIDHPELKKRYRHNLGLIKVQDETSSVYRVVLRIRAHRDGFLALIPGSGIEVLDCDINGKVRATYRAPDPEEGSWGLDFICREDGTATWIYFMQMRPDSRVHVYKIETQPRI